VGTDFARFRVWRKIKQTKNAAENTAAAPHSSMLVSRVEHLGRMSKGKNWSVRSVVSLVQRISTAHSRESATVPPKMSTRSLMLNLTNLMLRLILQPSTTDRSRSAEIAVAFRTGGCHER
jgi:hypothetical protein